MGSASAGSKPSAETLSPPFSAPPRLGLLGVAPNQRWQGHQSTLDLNGIQLSIVEFDDQGRCYSRYQMKHLQEALDGLKGKRPIILVFVHGWKHNGRSDDENLRHFADLLHHAASLGDAKGRPVLGIFVAWRGLSLHGLKLENLTFWDRKQAGTRVAMGATRELFERVRKFKNDERGEPTLIIIGHSFGGLIVYTALAQSLMRSAIAPADEPFVFANLVLLVNPAFEAVRYLPIHDLVRERYDRLDTAHGTPQLPEDEHRCPSFCSVTAENDFATKWLFRAGMLYSLVQEAARGKEGKALTRTMGHIEFMRTHELAMKDAAGRPANSAHAVRVRFAPDNPFWVMSASKDVIDNHNGIWLPAFQDWVQRLLTHHID